MFHFLPEGIESGEGCCALLHLRGRLSDNKTGVIMAASPRTFHSQKKCVIISALK
jgi:hypothetical protein